MSKRFEFKRDFFYELLSAIDKSHVTFLLGPRKCGKTVCMRQIEHNIDHTFYESFKNLNQDESMRLFQGIIDDIKNDKEIIYLLDEITYAFRPENEINRVADCFATYENTKTKIVFTGSQSLALESWGNRAFCGNAMFLHVDFLSYGEWLKYKGGLAASIKTYTEFLYNVRDFYQFKSLESYLKGCLEETIISNYNTSNYVFGNDVDSVTLDSLLDICYTTMFTLHNHVNNSTFSKNSKLLDDLGYYYREVCEDFESTELSSRIATSFIGRYNSFKARDLRTLKQSFNFLQKCDLITITPMMDNCTAEINIERDLLSDESSINIKNDLFRKYNVCIRYPMFYVEILKDILGNEMPDCLPNQLLGSIVECHVRGILPSTNCFEYHDYNGRELDYVNRTDCMAMEITVSNKRLNTVNFSVVNDYSKVLLTKDILEKEQGILKIPYYVLLACDKQQLSKLLKGGILPTFNSNVKTLDVFDTIKPSNQGNDIG